MEIVILNIFLLLDALQFDEEQYVVQIFYYFCVWYIQNVKYVTPNQ